MPRRLTRAAALLAATALAAPAPALAASYTHLDPAHDVQRISSAGDASHARHDRTADIVRVAIAHSRRRLRTVVIVRAFATGWDYAAQIRTPTHRFTIVGDRADGSTRFTLASASTTKPVSCPGFAHHIVKREGKVAVTVPAACLGKPRWVREGVAMLVPGHHGAMFADDGLRHGGFAHEKHLTRSPRVHR
jgi:hypothetical protein